MFERFSGHAREVVVSGQVEARRLGHGRIDTDHLLLGLLAAPDGAAATALRWYGLSADGLRTWVAERHPAGERPGRHIPFTRPAKRALVESLRATRQTRHRRISSGHMLLGLLAVQDGMAVRALTAGEVDVAWLRAEVMRHIDSEAA